MIIREDGTFETNSSYPNSNWYEGEDNFVLDETTDEGRIMAKTFIENFPFIDFEHDGVYVTKVIALDKPEIPPEVEGKEVQLIKNDQGEWEYIYVDIPLTKEQELQIKVSNLEQENLNLMLVTTEIYETMFEENTNLMLALTEVYELLLGGM